MIALVIIWILFGIASAMIMTQKNRSGCAGLFLGFLFGPIGLILCLVADQGGKDKSKLVQCDACGNDVSKKAMKCPQCGQPMP